jgi:hypothetical protein
VVVKMQKVCHVSKCPLLYPDIIYDSESRHFISMSGSVGRQMFCWLPYRNGCHSMTGNCINELKRLSFCVGWQISVCKAEHEAARRCSETLRDLLRPIGSAAQLCTISGAR